MIMTVYVLYVPTARRSVTGIALEKFSSREFTAKTLLRRNATGIGPTFYLDDNSRAWDKSDAVFPDADETGYMRVFLRRATDPVPDLLDTPDEEWIVESGGRRGIVHRLPWTDGDDTVEPDASGTIRTVPARRTHV